MTNTKWNPFPYPQTEYQYEGDTLKSRWEELHCGDKEVYPTPESIQQFCDAHPAAKASLPNSDYAEAALTLQQAWRLYHKGDYQQATTLGLGLGLPGLYVATRAQSMYANYLEKNENTKRELFNEVIRRCEQAATALPDYANLFYINAYAIGRYSQSISVVTALAQGLGGKVKTNLDKALALQPDHAEAHTALGTYHAEIVDKVGSLVAGLTYGAKKELGLEHFEKAMALTPKAPVVYIEYGNGLLMIFGRKREKDVIEAYEKATELQPLDATQRLDVEDAKAKFE